MRIGWLYIGKMSCVHMYNPRASGIYFQYVYVAPCSNSQYLQQDKNGYTPLMYACLMGCSSVAKLLIIKGASLTAKVLTSLSILHALYHSHM